MSRRVVVLGLDGMPSTLLTKLFSKGKMGNLKSIIELEGIKELKPVYPVISSVEWTSYATGTHPGKHGIFGFVERHTNPFGIYIPTSKERKVKPIWQVLSQQNKKVTVINLPITYPVEEVNGKMISCFLCTDIQKGTYPRELAYELEKEKYIIDADAWIARENKEQFLDQLIDALDARFRVGMKLFDEDFDYFHLHIMETDRLFHFFWYALEEMEVYMDEKIERFFDKLDDWIGKLLAKLREDDTLIVLSDHGFCGIKYEVQVNTWLQEKGYLKLAEGDTNIAHYLSETTCYSLTPGRIYINLEGREERGSVSPKDYEAVRRQIKSDLLALEDPITKEKIIEQVFFKEELYSVSLDDNAPDLVAHPKNGYDLKGMDQSNKVFTHSALEGMHTYENAILIGRNFDTSKIESIQDIYTEILNII